MRKGTLRWLMVMNWLSSLWLTNENGFKIPESLPALHDKVLPAAADAVATFSSNQKKKKADKNGFIFYPISTYRQAGSFWAAGITSLITEEEVVELDDVKIDEPEMPASRSSYH